MRFCLWRHPFIFSILWYRKLERHNPLVASSSTPPQECAHKRECKYNNRYVLQRYRHSFRITGDQSGSLFILQNLDLYETKTSLHSGGTILLSGRITFHKTFEEPGKWYFISFPFDVYPPWHRLHFEQKDANA